MAYAVEVQSLVHRQSTIARAVTSTSDKERFRFRGRLQDLPVVRLPISLPIYRLENFRTRVRQSEYVRKNKLAQDFFIKGQESEAAQQAQHDILVEMAKRGRGSTVVPILDVLRKEDQNERLVITSTGVVVNGNRRLAGMRELYTEDPTAFGRFQWVDCVVLPADARPEELRELEVRLQMTLETRLPYEWVCECLAIRELENANISRDTIAEMMNQSRAAINRKAAALDHADLYLEEWVQKPKEYSLIERGEQIFGEMAKALERRSGEQLEVGRALGFFIFDNVSDIEDRAYEYRSAFGPNIEKVVTTVAKNMGVELSSSTTNRRGKESGQLAVDFGDSPSGTGLKNFIPALKDKKNAKQLIEEIKNACQLVADAANEDKAGQRALATLKTVARNISQVDLSTANPATYGEIQEALSEVAEAAKALAQQLKKLMKDR